MHIIIGNFYIGSCFERRTIVPRTKEGSRQLIVLTAKEGSRQLIVLRAKEGSSSTVKEDFF